jgi:hypothetical protein
MKTLWCKNQENPSDRISHAWAPLNKKTQQQTIERLRGWGLTIFLLDYVP